MQKKSLLPGTRAIWAVLVAVIAPVLFLCLPNPAAAQGQPGAREDSVSLKEALRTHRHAVRLLDGELRGEGGQMLRKQAVEARAIVLGESHGTKEIPALMSALLKALQEQGELDYLALETSPWTTARMSDSLQKGKSAYNRLVEKYPEAIPFYNLRAERDLVAEFVARSEKQRPLWGLDQIFLFAGPIAFDRLKELAPSAEVRRSIEEIQAAGSERTAEDPRLQKLPPSVPTPISIYPPAAFDTLRSQFAGSGEAQALLEELSTSAEIYRLNETDNYESNQIRAEYLRQNLRRRAEQAAEGAERPAQIAIKIGAWHAYRGLTPNNVLDVGNLAVELSERAEGEAFTFAISCGPGSEGRAFPDRSVECWPDRLGEAFRSLTEGAADKVDAVLFDLRAIRPLLHEGALSPREPVEELIWGLDALVLVPGARPAERIVPFRQQ